MEMKRRVRLRTALDMGKSVHWKGTRDTAAIRQALDRKDVR